MPEEVHVILDLAPEIQTLLEQQGVDLYEEIQRELPASTNFPILAERISIASCSIVMYD